jgi:hypothetical protein
VKPRTPGCVHQWYQDLTREKVLLSIIPFALLAALLIWSLVPGK